MQSKGEMRIADVLAHSEAYEKPDVKVSWGLLLQGGSGIGKTILG